MEESEVISDHDSESELSKSKSSSSSESSEGEEKNDKKKNNNLEKIDTHGRTSGTHVAVEGGEDDKSKPVMNRQVSMKIHSAIKHGIGVDLRKSRKDRQAKKEQKKAQKGRKTDYQEEESQQKLDLDDMEIIAVSSDEEKGPGGPKDKKYERKDMPYFDFMPDEVCLNIYSYLSENEAGRLASVCKRFASLLHEEAFWEEKAKGWIHTYVSKPDQAVDALKNYYVTKFKENKATEIRKRDEAERAKKQRRWEKKKSFLKTCFTVYWSLASMEIPSVIAILLWTIFLALRIDEIILWSYHLVFLPVYIVMGHILCGLCSMEVIYAYFESKPSPPSFESHSTALIIYDELTPMEDHVRAKTSTYIWWATVISFFVLLAEGLNTFGTLSTGWCLFSVLVGVSFLSCCFLSWKPSSYNWCDGDKCRGGMAFFLFFCSVSWIALFMWTKAEFFADFSWYSAFSPWWILALGCSFLLGVSFVLFIENRHSSDFKIYAGMIGTATVAFICICSFLVLLSINLEALYRDQPTWPWILVFVPLIVFEVFSVFACCGLAYAVNK